jgi:hypothetical protein
MTRIDQRCSRCQRPAPPADNSPEGQAAEGWTVYQGESELAIDVPADGAVLPLALVEQIREFEGLIHIYVMGPHEPGTAAAREIGSYWLGLVCPDCQAETGWDFEQWELFFATHRRGKDR